MSQIKVNTVKMAEIVLNGENYVAKIRNTIAHLEVEFPKTKSSSPQVMEFRKVMTKVFGRINEAKQRADRMAKALDQRRAELEKLEGSADIFAQARASHKEAGTATKVNLR